MMPETNSALMMDLTKMDQCQECAAQGLNSLAYTLIKQGPVQSSEVTWKNLDFKDFGPQPICALTDQTKMTEESEAPAELLCKAWLKHTSSRVT